MTRTFDISTDDSQIIQLQVNFLTVADSLIANDPCACMHLYERIKEFKETDKSINSDTSISLSDLLGQLTAIVIVKGKKQGSESYLHEIVNKHLEVMSVISATGSVFCWE